MTAHIFTTESPSPTSSYCTAEYDGWEAQHLRALASEYGQVHPFCTRFAIDNGSCFFAATCNIIMRKVINLGFAQLKWISTVDITSEVVKKLRNDRIAPLRTKSN